MNKIRPCFSLDKTNSYHNNLEGYGNYILKEIKRLIPMDYKLIQAQKKGTFIWIDLDATMTFHPNVYLESQGRVNVDKFEVV